MTNIFAVSIYTIISFFFSRLLIQWITWIDFQISKQSCIPVWSSLGGSIIFFLCMAELLGNILLRILASVFMSDTASKLFLFYFLGMSFMLVNGSFIKWVWKCCLCFCFLIVIVWNWCYFFFECLVEFAS